MDDRPGPAASHHSGPDGRDLDPAAGSCREQCIGPGLVGIGAYGLEQARQHIEQTRALTDRPFNVNLFCHRAPAADAEREAQWLRYLAPEFERYGASAPPGLRCIYESAQGNARLQAMVLELRPAVVSFHFGLPEQSFVDALRAAGITMLACATSLDEARQIEQAGVDVIVAQGMEAGGHRGAFVPEQDTLMGTLALVRLLARESRLPVVAAGGIMDGAGIAAALQLGACAAQMGTAFILCPESAASPAYRAELQSDSAQHTAITAAISGVLRAACSTVCTSWDETMREHCPPIPWCMTRARRCTRQPARKAAATMPRTGPVRAHRWLAPCPQPNSCARWRRSWSRRSTPDRA